MIIFEEIDPVEPCPQISEMMTLEEIERRFPDEWILMVDPVMDGHLTISRGTVVGHSKDGDQVEQLMVQLRPKSSALFFVEVTPDEEIFAL